MNKFKFLILSLLTSLITFSACSDDEKNKTDLEKSNANSIIEFTIKDAEIEINETNNEDKWIYGVLPYGSDLTSITPIIKVSDKATIKPNIGEAVDFTNDVIYKVTAENGDIAEYEVTLNVRRASDCDILSFEIESLGENKVGVIDEKNRTITFSVHTGTDVTALVPTIVINGRSISPASQVAQDFTKPVVYTVRAENATPGPYTVTVKEQSPSDAEFISFEMRHIYPTPKGILDKETNTMKIYVPADVDKSKMTPLIQYKGSSISPKTVTNGVQDFSKPVTYTITATDGTKNSIKVEVVDYAFIPQITTINKTVFRWGEEIRVTGKFTEDAKLYFKGIGRAPRYPEMIKVSETEIIAVAPDYESSNVMWGDYILYVETPTGSAKYDTRIKFLDEE